MSMTIEATRPYQRLDLFDKMAVDAQIKAFLAHVRRQSYSKPQKTPSSPPVAILEANEPQAQPEPPVVETPELDMSFITETQTQKRTRKPEPRPATKEKAPLYDRTVKSNVVAFIAEHGPVTSAAIGQHFGMHLRRTSVVLADLQKKQRIFIVGYTKNEYNQIVKLLHTDPNFVYVSPDLPNAEPIVEEKRPAHKPPSRAAIERGRALVARNFRRDSIAMQVFEQLCRRPLSIPELDAIFRRGSSCFKFMLDRMQDLGIVEKVGQDRNDASGKLRVLWGVVETEDAPPAPRVPPSPETIAKGREMIIARCIKHGGKTLETFDELCTNGPLTRGDLAERLGCHRTMIDVALRTLDTFGLVVDLGKVIGDETGHMRRLWDVRP